MNTEINNSKTPNEYNVFTGLKKKGQRPDRQVFVVGTRRDYRKFFFFPSERSVLIVCFVVFSSVKKK